MAAKGQLSSATYTDSASASISTVTVAGSFICVNGADPTNCRGEGYTVARSAEGVYDITFATSYPLLISCVVSLEDAATTIGDDTFEVFTAPYAAGALEIRGQLAGVNDDLATIRVNFVAVFQTDTLEGVTHT